jgi:predicted aspartyl protease
MRFATSFITVCFAALALPLTALPAAAQAAPSPAPAAGTSLEALLTKSREASGAPYRYHIVSRARETHDGATYVVTTETQGLKYRAESCAKSLCSGFYFDGERSFNTNFNDTALPLSAGVDGLQITLRAIASYAFADPDFTKNGGTLVERDAILRDGKRLRRISVAPRLGALLDAIVDPASGLVVGVISDERKYAFEFSDQRRIGNGVTLPYSISLNGYTFTKYDERSVVSASLEAPAGVVPDFGAGAVEVAMQKGERAETPIVACTIGGLSATCALDTGDSGLSMSLQFAKKLGIHALDGTYGEHGPGQYVSGVAKAPALAIGTATFASANYVVLHDLQQNGYDVILGADVFAHARITLDFAKRHVEFAPASTPASGGLPIGFDDFVPIVTAELDGKNVSVAVDTGAAGSIGLSSDYSDRHPEFVKGASTTLRLGASEIKDQTLDPPQKMPFNGRIGSTLLQHFTATFDYGRGSLSLAPRE